MNSTTLWVAMALVLIIEGLLPFISPGTYRSVFSRIAQLQDGQIRFYGLCSICIGLVLWWVVA
jgi:uncharacterized protein